MATKITQLRFIMGALLGASIASCAPGDTSNGSPIMDRNDAGDTQSPLPTSDVKLLTYPTQPRTVYQATGMQGVLRSENGCLLFEANGLRYLLYFPAGMVEWNGNANALKQGGTSIPLGSRVEMMGRPFEGREVLPTLDDPGQCDTQNIFMVFPNEIQKL